MTQGIQIFPGVIAGFFQQKGRDKAELPENVRSTFLETTRGAAVEFWEVLGEETAPLYGYSLVFFHGNAETIDTTIDLQRWLASLGLTVYSIEYRGFGRSSGWPSESALNDDALMIWRFLHEERDVSPEKLIVLGRSIGSGPAAFLASKINPRALALLAPYRSIPALVDQMPLLQYLRPFLWYEFPVESYLQQLKETCVILAHGERDNIIPFEHSRYLYQLISDNVEAHLISAEAAGHNDLMWYIEESLPEHMLKCLIGEQVSSLPENAV